MNTNNLAIKHDFQYQRIFVRVKGGIAYLKYDQPIPNVLDFKETYVPVDSRGRGVGTELVKHTINYALSKDFSIIPTCPFVNHFITTNPEYQKVLKRDIP